MKAALLVLLALSAGEGPGGGSPEPFGWRGDGTGRFPAATPPLEWGVGKNVRWSVPVGAGYASPVVAGELVVVASEPDLLVAVARADGKERWRLRTTPAELPPGDARTAAEAYKPKDTGLAAATPVVDGETVYMAFANGIVRAVDLAGRGKWIAHIDAPQTTAYGRSASPLLTAGRLIVHMTHLYAFDPATGRQLWVNSDARCAYGTPAAVRANGVDLVVTPAGDVVRADDGKGVNSQIGAASNSSPVAGDGLIFFAEKDVRAIRLGADFKDESVWNAEIAGEVFGSPVLHDGLLFAVTGKGELYVFDARAKGAVEPLVKARPLFGEEPPAEPLSYSSLALAGKHLFLATHQGEVLVFEATREARRVAKNELKDGSGACPAFAGGELYLRDGSTLACIAR